MILLDTNVVSEPLRPQAEPVVLDWLDRQAVETLFLSATSLSELLLGLELLPDGRRRDGLAATLRALLCELFGPRILPFDAAAAEAYATLLGQARRAGRAIGVADGQIAAIAHAGGYTVASRDTAPFVAAGVPVVNPWQAGA